MYASFFSMSTPHVAGVAALVWSNFPECTAKQIRTVLKFTATDLGTAGCDNSFGGGRVDATSAYNWLNNNGCASVDTLIAEDGCSLEPTTTTPETTTTVITDPPTT